MKAFISYSHRDSASLERLHTHLAMLRREGAVTEWYDREILAGDQVDNEVSVNLENSDLFLALASPDFLHSNYCYEKEMERAIEKHDSGQMRIIPIIVEPCDWKASPLVRFKALPRDGEPISDWTNENNAYLDIVNELRRVVQNEGTEHPPSMPTESVSETVQTRYRIKKNFDDIDRGDFRDVAFQAIRDYFQKSIAEIDTVEGLRGRFRELGPQSFSCTVLNQMKERTQAHITVHAASNPHGFGDITYSFSENAPANTANGWLSIESDEFDLYLKQHGFSRMGEDQRVSQQTAAEMLWEEFLSNAGISYD
jgi:hypothetical protein